jgi:hypothetical protein
LPSRHHLLFWPQKLRYATFTRRARKRVDLFRFLKLCRAGGTSKPVQSHLPHSC